MTLTGIRNSIVLVGVLLLAVMVADAAGFDPFDSDTDLRHDERRVEIRFFATSSLPNRPVRFDIMGGFNNNYEFDEDDKRDQHRKSSITYAGNSVWAKMFVRVDSAEPRRMECEIWQGNKEITQNQEIFPELPIAYCAGVAK